jgi:hypothetical protein
MVVLYCIVIVKNYGFKFGCISLSTNNEEGCVDVRFVVIGDPMQPASSKILNLVSQRSEISLVTFNLAFFSARETFARHSRILADPVTEDGVVLSGPF